MVAAEARSDGLSLDNVDVAPRTLHAIIGGVRVGFLQYGYPLVAPPVERPDLSVRLASLDDLAAVKLAAVSQR